MRERVVEAAAIANAHDFICEWVMSQSEWERRKSLVICSFCFEMRFKACRTGEWVMSHINEACRTREWVMSRISISLFWNVFKGMSHVNQKWTWCNLWVFAVGACCVLQCVTISCCNRQCTHFYLRMAKAQCVVLWWCLCSWLQWMCLVCCSVLNICTNIYVHTQCIYVYTYVYVYMYVCCRLC